MRAYWIWIALGLALLGAGAAALAEPGQRAAFLVFDRVIPFSFSAPGVLHPAFTRVKAERGQFPGSFTSVDCLVGSQAPLLAVADGNGGIIIAGQIKKKSGRVLVLQRIDSAGKTLWGSGQGTVVKGDYEDAELAPSLATDGSGGVVVVFQAHRKGGPVEILAQRVGKSGRLLWNQGRPVVVASSPELSKLHPQALAGEGGQTLVAFQSTPTNPPAAAEVTIEGQALSSQGHLLWNEGRPRVICGYSQSAGVPVLVGDGAGGMFVVFEIGLIGGTLGEDFDVDAMRVGATGDLLWAQPKVVSSTPNLERWPVAISDGQGGIIVAFVGRLNPGEGPTDYDILGQRLDGAGNRIWNQGNPIFLIASSDDDTQPALASDGQGGALVFGAACAREDPHPGACKILACRVNTAGILPWKEGKETIPVAVSTQWSASHPDAVGDGEGGALVAFRLKSLAQSYGPLGPDTWVGLSRIGPDGRLLWGAEGEPDKLEQRGISSDYPVLVNP